MEYGTFVIAVVGIAIMFFAISDIPVFLHNFIQAFVTVITGVPSEITPF
jgi:hypothetical protein